MINITSLLMNQNVPFYKNSHDFSAESNASGKQLIINF